VWHPAGAPGIVAVSGAMTPSVRNAILMDKNTNVRNSAGSEKHQARAALLARSLVPLCAMTLASQLLVFPALLLHQSDASVFWRWSVAWMGGIAAYVALMVALSVTLRCLFSHSADSLQATIARVLRPPFDHFLWGFSVLSSFITTGLLVNLLFLDIDGPLKALLGLVLFWQFMLWVLLAGLYWTLVRRVMRVAQPWLVGIGLAVVLVLLLEGCFRAYEQVFGSISQPAEVSSEANLDTAIPGAGDVPWVPAYRAEFEALEAQWTPFVYWRRKQFSGRFINIDERGVRKTLPPPGSPDIRLFLLGGSTAWGTGARDEYTIASDIVTSMAGKGISAEVTNFGESGYIARQDATLALAQLQQNNIPDVAVFYWGYNDVYSTWQTGYVGLPLNERGRIAEFEFGRSARWSLPPGAAFVSLVYDTALGSRLLSWWGVPDAEFGTGEVKTSSLGKYTDANMVLTTYPGKGPHAVAGYFGTMMTYVQHLAKLYDMRVVFVWQPVPYLKRPLCTYEKEYLDRFMHNRRDLVSFYHTVDDDVRQLGKEFGDNLLILSDLFEGHNECVFSDYVHTTEEANRAIAEQIAQRVAALIGKGR
jgi:lysophospholipase L1-like esterase